MLNLRGAPQVRSGRSTTYRIWVTNAAEVPCAIGLKEQPLQLEITSGTDRIWSTRDCVKLAPSGILKIRAGETRVFPVTWTTQRSRSGCTLVDEELRGGTYWAKVTWGQYSKTYRTVLYL